MRIGTPAEIGLRIRDRRRELGLSQAELATQIGTSRQWIIEMEHGKTRAELGLVLKTLSALGLTLDVREPSALGTGRARPVPPIDIDEIVERARGDERERGPSDAGPKRGEGK